jgi:hypothetical protein
MNPMKNLEPLPALFARVLAPPEFFAEHGDNEEAFEQLVEFHLQERCRRNGPALP